MALGLSNLTLKNTIQEQLSLAFPSISTGIFGYPPENAARIALNTVTDELPELSSIHYLRFVLYSTAELYLYEQLFTSESRKKKS